MQLLEWLILCLVYLATYGLWSGLEARRERAPYRPQRVHPRRRAVRFGVLALCLLGLGLAYNSPAVQEMLRDASPTPFAPPETEPQETRTPPPLTEYERDGAQLVTASPPLLGATRDAPEGAARADREVSVAALPRSSISANVSTPISTPPVAAPPEVARPVAVPAERTSAPPAQPSGRAERSASRPRPTVISPRPSEPQVRLSFQSDPTGATLYVDGERVGVTPTSIWVEAGARLHYTLRAESNLPNHALYYPHLDMLEPTQNANLSVWLERLNSEEVAALQARGGARGLPDFDSFD